MTPLHSPRKIDILSIPALALIFVLWIVPGIFGRDPWKADEPYTVALVSDMLRTGDWTVPSLTGETFLEKPPLVYLTAAGFGLLLSPPLQMHEAARLATVLFMSITVLFLALTARELYGRESGAAAAILLIGCVHLQTTAHKLITDVGMLAGLATALYGFSLSRRRSTPGGLWAGTGAGVAFLSKGLLVPGILGMTAVLLPALFPIWRRKDHLRFLAAGLLAALPWLLIWPVALCRRSADLFWHWFWEQNIGRFLGLNGGNVGFDAAAPHSHVFYLPNLPWLAWPVVMLAGWSLWHFRRSWRGHPAFQVPFVTFIAILATLSASATNRALYALPMLLPLVLIAVPGIAFLPLKVTVVGNRASVLLFGYIASLLWLGWLVMMTGIPPAFARALHAFQPDYLPSVNGFLLTAALLYSALWLLVVVRITRSPEYMAVNWGLGIVLAWGLLMTLWLPALNAGSSFQPAFTALKGALPHTYRCIASTGLGESERGMLEYYTGLQTHRTEVASRDGCDLMLEQRAGTARPAVDSTLWRPFWEFRHPSIRPKDIFTLYRKARSGYPLE